MPNSLSPFIKAEIKQAKAPEEKAGKATMLAGITNNKYAILKNEKNLNNE